VLSVLGRAAEDVVRLAGDDSLDGKVLIDASDPLDFSSGRPGLFVGTTDSLGERIQRLVPKARVVKALNTVVADVMVNPALSGGEPDMFIAGEDTSAQDISCAYRNRGTGIEEAQSSQRGRGVRTSAGPSRWRTWPRPSSTWRRPNRDPAVAGRTADARLPAHASNA
jgi:hypothetical protein